MQLKGRNLTGFTGFTDGLPIQEQPPNGEPLFLIPFYFIICKSAFPVKIQCFNCIVSAEISEEPSLWNRHHPPLIAPQNSAHLLRASAAPRAVPLLFVLSFQRSNAPVKCALHFLRASLSVVSSGTKQQLVNGGSIHCSFNAKQNRRDTEIYDTHRTNISHLRRDGGISRRNPEHNRLQKFRGDKRQLLRQHLRQT
jgi:hypothetical protein